MWVFLKKTKRERWMEVLTIKKTKQNKHECEIMRETNGEHELICSMGGRKGGGKIKTEGPMEENDTFFNGGGWGWLIFILHDFTSLLETDIHSESTHGVRLLLLKGCERRENGVNGSKMVLTLLPTQVRLRPSPSLLSLVQLQYKARQSGAAPSKGGNKPRVWYRHFDYLQIICCSGAACNPAVSQMFKELLQLRQILAKSRRIVTKPPYLTTCSRLPITD